MHGREPSRLQAAKRSASIPLGLIALLVTMGIAIAAVSPRLQELSQSVPIAMDHEDSAPDPMAARLFAAAHWAAITDQRRDVLDISRSDVVRVLRGMTRDWSELGGAPQPISVYLSRSQTRTIAEMLGLSVAELSVELLNDNELLNRVATTRGSFALVETQQLRLGVLALTVDGHDPYRDPGLKSPLRQLRFVDAPRTPADIQQFAATLQGLPHRFDPVGVAVTGELIPVRCTNHVLAELDDYDAMFDGVRDGLVAADLAVAALEHPLISDGELTPCEATLVFTGSHRAVPAMANAGLDVLFTIGNHMKDCWGGCSGKAALVETLGQLSEAGIETAGAGENLDAARAPTVVRVDTRSGPVRCAFLGYDTIAPWYHATEDRSGTAPLEAEYLRDDIAHAVSLADHVIVGANWGVEYTSNPVFYQRQLAGVAIEAGASLLVGHHPHWVQAVEHLGDAFVAYSMGNFVFDQAWSVPTTQGMVIELGFTTERLLGYRIRPVVIRAHSSRLPWIYRPEFVDPATEGRPIPDRVWRAQDRLPARSDGTVD